MRETSMNNPKSSVAPVVMDARKFVRQVNNSAAAKLKFFEESVTRMGKSVNKQLRLTSLDSTSLIYEDVDKNSYYIADIKKGNRGKVQLENVRPIQIVEEDKAAQFDKNVTELVEQICEGNFTQADKVFNKIESQRFRSRVIPESGWITLKDGVSRHVPVSTRIVQEDHVQNIVKLFSEAVKDTVEVDRGRIVRGTLSDGHEKFVIPINEYTRRRLVAFKMRDAANKAYQSSAFQDLVMECAALVCEGNVNKAVKVAAKFLKEEQEFSLLNTSEMKNLVESTMASRLEFNSMLANDVATLFYKTSAKVNRDAILEAWAKVAQTSEHSGLLTNVNVLAESEDFGADYERFLDIVFNEEMDIQSARAKAYRTTLRVVASILPDLEDEDGEEVSTSVDELNELIERLSGPEPDTDAVLQAEELLAGISDSLIDSIQDLEGFDSVPGEEEEEAEGEEGDLVPLPEVGEGEEEEELPPMGEEGEEEEEEGPPPPPVENVQRRLVPVERMKSSNLLEELEDWRIHGENFLREYGYDQCYNDMERYIKRCIELGSGADVLRESFENMRDRLIQSGNTILEDVSDDDPYAESLLAALNGSDRLLEDKTKRDPERDPAFWGTTEKTKSESRINRDYRHTYIEGEQPYELSGGLNDASGLRMDDLRGSGGVASTTPAKSDGRSAGGSAAGYHKPQRGQGVAKKGAKPVDGRKGEHSTSGAASGSLRMDDQQGGGGVQSQGLGSTDGRKGHGTASQRSESTVSVTGGDPALTKSGYGSVGLSMGKDHQGTSGKGGVVPKSLKKGDGASGDGASSAKNYEASGGLSSAGHDMSEYQGGGGVEDDSLDPDPHKGQGRVKSDGGLKKANKGGDMSQLQGGGGVAESITPDRIAALIDEMEEDSISEAKACAKCGKVDCPCGCAGDESKCKCEAVTEGEVPEAFKKNWKKKDSDSDDDSGDEKPDADSDNIPNWADKDPDSPGGDEDRVDENQYKGPTRKYSNMGYDKSSLNPREDKESGDAISEERVAAFVGTPDSVAAAVDQALEGGLGDELSGADEDVLPPPAEPEMGPEMEPEGDLGSPEDKGEDLEDALDSALGDEDEGLEDEELASEGAGEESSESDSESESDESDETCEGCGKVVCECD